MQAVKARLEAYKEAKAKEIARLHRTTKQSVECLISKFKDQFSYEALCIIDSRYKRSAEKKPKDMQEGGSTLPSSEERQG